MKTIHWCLLALLTVCAGCRKDAVEPGMYVAGSYEATYYIASGGLKEPYPVNGQTITLWVEQISHNRVNVSIQANPNDRYSPGQNMTYYNALVEDDGNNYKRIWLGGLVVGRLSNTITVFPDQVAQYVYRSPDRPASDEMILLRKN